MTAMRCFTVLLLSVALVVPAAEAASEKDPKADQIRRLQQAQRKTEQERARMAEEKAALESQVKELEEKQAAAQRAIEASGRRVVALNRELAELRKTMGEKLDQADKLHKEQARVIQKLEAEGKRLQTALNGEKQQHAACVALNQEMHKTGLDILERYEKKSCTDSVLQGEPFTGLKRVEIENAVEDLRDKLDSFKAGS